VAQTETTAERVAQNNVTFRKANEQIGEAAQQYVPDEAVPFICECPDTSCTELVRLTLPEYEAVRAYPTHFINAPGHHAAAAGWAQVVEPRDGYDIVEKVGRAGRIAEDLDPRSS